MNTVLEWHKGRRPRGALIALCMTALCLGPCSLAAAQNHAGRSPADDAMTGSTSSDTDSLDTSGTQDSATFSTYEAPTVVTPVAAGSGNQSPPPTAPSSSELSPSAGCDPDADTSVGEAGILPGPASYMAQNPDLDSDDVVTSWIGVSLSPDSRKLKSGEYVDGLLIVDVQAGSPAAKAGLQPPIEGKVRTAAEIATLAAGMVFPPAMVGAAVISSAQFDQSYDMIIGVDGDRITNIPDFEDHLCMVQPGEIVYLNIVRNGKRRQVPVTIP
jgi:PDZ domain